MKTFLKKHYLFLLYDTAKNNLNKQSFNQDNFKVFQFSILANVFLSLVTTVLYRKISFHTLNVAICFFVLCSFLTITSFIFTITYIKLLNKSYLLTKKEGGNALNIVDNQIKDLEKEKIIQEKKFLDSTISKANLDNSKSRIIRKI